MSHEIVALRCPSCAAGIGEPSRAMAFGAEFRCDHCGVVSVLIVDQALVALSTLQRQGDRVCTTCGRVATREARFCQEGHSLVRKCVNQACLKEFPVDHQRCDHCGWLQGVKPGTPEGLALEIDRAINDLSDVSPQVVEAAIRRLRVGGAAGRAAAKVLVPLLLQFVETVPEPNSFYFRDDAYPHDTFSESWEAIASLGPAAVDAMPLLRNKLAQVWSTDWKVLFFLRCMVRIAPDDALRLCDQIWKEENALSKKAEYAVCVAYDAGKAGIPNLARVSGFFGVPAAKEALKALHGGYSWPPKVDNY